MISILIPIYNRDVIRLIGSLHKQCEKLDKEYEILCYDDCSQQKFQLKNRSLSNLLNVSYVERSENLGRSKIRNRLAKNARFEKLIFLDCDIEITSKNFVENYLNALDQHQIIYGGISYHSKKPTAKTKFLHWNYGSKKEVKALAKRLQKPYQHFTSANFAALRSSFLKIQFNEEIVQYGHEDSFFAMSAEEQKIPIGHIENPVKHLGLKTNKRFMDDVDRGIENLLDIQTHHKQFHTRLSKTFEKLKKYNLDRIFLTFYKNKEANIRARLIENKAGLRHLDLYKLIVYSRKKLEV